VFINTVDANTGYTADVAMGSFICQCANAGYTADAAMHSYICQTQDCSYSSTHFYQQHATKPLSLCFNGLTVDSLLRLALPAVGLLDRLSRRSGVSDLTSRILQWVNLASPSASDTAPSHSETSQREPPPIQNVRPDAPRYEWLWLKTKRVFVKAFLNVLRRQIRTVSLPSWALGLSIRRSPATSSGLTTMVFAAGLPHPCSPTYVLTVSRVV
jgi:hypothetical protein